MRNFKRNFIFFKNNDMTNSALIKQIQSSFVQEGRPEIRTGMEIEVHQLISE